MDQLVRIAARSSRLFAWLGGFLLLGVAVLITFEVITRKFFGFSMSGADEISGYVLAIVTAWTFSYCVTSRSNIRIDVVYHVMPDRLRALADVIGLFVLAVFATFLALRGAQVLLVSIEYGSRSVTTLSTPLWIPQLGWASGLVFFAIVVWTYLLRCAALLLRRQTSEVGKLAGIGSVIPTRGDRSKR
ncbi:MAG: TRAP transporter small permease [Roseovarius sp.]|nr:TRAP transporter small permease [Roseovarius sp.]MCY4207824.1 TRAP transporter small permease [Roseovarius sp.]MCY4292797.1 TRAP transporter small permease [Roseovarius sp.]MCY4316716.1 TRAP transporter small permease [Roseovarius sp.]